VNQTIDDWPTVIEQNSNYPVEQIIKSVYAINKSDDFFYTTNKPGTWAKSISENAELTIKINAHFTKWAKLFKTNKSRQFKFDEDYYLELNGDVKQSVKDGRNKSGMLHFKTQGHTEFRSFKLSAIKKQ
jgi:hypothetical protein